MFEPLTANKRQENLHFSRRRINQGRGRTCDVYLVHQPRTF